MQQEANSSHDTTSSSGNGKEPKRQQFSNKQRMDMYAFCVLELEMHSNKVSIKKQQQAIQKVLFEKQGIKSIELVPTSNGNGTVEQPNSYHLQQQQPQPQPSSSDPQQQPSPALRLPIEHAANNGCEPALQNHQQQPTVAVAIAPAQPPNLNNSDNSNGDGNGINGVEGKTLLQLQQEVAMTNKCYSDYQKTQVLTSSMLRDVQARFAKYYPNSAIPSRTTIKHVFEKCVSHGTVENIKTPRKATKIPQGDEIEYLLIHEPQLSLRQMAQKLNVSTGTVSRRCKALGLVPESVTIKHQQLATARRQKQIKHLESQSKQMGVES